MALRTVKLPDIGEGIAEAEIVEVKVAEGDVVREDQMMFAVMTDKATVEIPSPVTGTVAWIGAKQGDRLVVGSDLVKIETGAADTKPEERPAANAKAPAAPKQAAPPPSRPPMPESPPVASNVIPMGAPRAKGEKPLASPAVRLRAREAGVDLAFVRGTGPAGRITHEDLDLYVSGRGAPVKAPGFVANPAIDDIKVAGIRRIIATRMQEAKRRIPHFAYVEETDVSELEDLRAKLNAAKPAARPKLTLLPFVIRAMVNAIRRFPMVNARFDDEAEIIHRYGGVHVGIATQTATGLMVPVIRHAEARDLWDCAAELKRVTDAARNGTATREELTGSTITVTSLGPLGGIVSTPVINAPEVAIVGVNKIAIRPVWMNGAFMPRKIMNLSSSFDHRVVDGHDAASFIQAVKEGLETPASLFLEM
jgi:2-oxoisovalerate dehydrogenase E2 component (dihydrolipoyl transacylase)